MLRKHRFAAPLQRASANHTTRWFRHQRKAIEYRNNALDGGGEREKARRVRQMVNEQLKAENGVIRRYEEGNNG